MGLDIAAYSNLRYLGHHEVAEDSEHPYDPETDERVHVEALAYDAFPHALLGIPNQQLKTYGSTRYIVCGCFEITEKTETYSFRAGSYSGYGRWRRDLADRFNPYRDNGQPSPEGPFYELLWFADNEGTIGELAAISLLADFRQYEVEYRAAHLGAEVGDYFVQKYADWLRACELAADSGLIDFH
jgi:hypothetical protein